MKKPFASSFPILFIIMFVNFLIPCLTFRSLLSSCSSFRDSQYGSGGAHVHNNHEFDSSTHPNQINADDASFLNGKLVFIIIQHSSEILVIIYIVDNTSYFLREYLYLLSCTPVFILL